MTQKNFLLAAIFLALPMLLGALAAALQRTSLNWSMMQTALVWAPVAMALAVEPAKKSPTEGWSLYRS